MELIRDKIRESRDQTGFETPAWNRGRERDRQKEIYCTLTRTDTENSLSEVVVPCIEFTTTKMPEYKTFEARPMTVVQFIFKRVVLERCFDVSGLNFRYRCSVPECEEDPAVYLNFTIPRNSEGLIEKCTRYAPANFSANGTSCGTQHFDLANVVGCDSYVYLETHSIVKEKDKVLLRDTPITERSPVRNFSPVRLGPLFSLKVKKKGFKKVCVRSQSFLRTRRMVKFFPASERFVATLAIDKRTAMCLVTAVTDGRGSWVFVHHKIGAIHHYLRPPKPVRCRDLRRVGDYRDARLKPSFVSCDGTSRMLRIVIARRRERTMAFYVDRK
ncbi:hypothetical protein EVAR_39360_1 [Eumeta japonica]|uniref:Uncharacterized protein n=1 Tax=Eumeta variegata TaxID=151549 RepID=A0A4C1WQL9_EUMVA|nr:hypothetical protein EVAR_39360_1 [Eumeta japonica]